MLILDGEEGKSLLISEFFWLLGNCIWIFIDMLIQPVTKPIYVNTPPYLEQNDELASQIILSSQILFSLASALALFKIFQIYFENSDISVTSQTCRHKLKKKKKDLNTTV